MTAPSCSSHRHTSLPEGFDRKPRDARAPPPGYNSVMVPPIDPELAWQAFARRDRALDGRFVVAVTTTGIYCRPSCPARRPRRAHVRFMADGAAASAAGFRACLRCRPDETARDTAAVTRAAALIAAADVPPTLDVLATAVGYAPHHFQRLFRRATGVSPARYARGLRAERAQAALSEEDRVTDAVYAAGYAAPGRFYADAGERLGMSPSAWANGGAGVTIRWTTVATSLGALLVAATSRGLCRVAFDEDAATLAARFPRAALVPGDAALTALAAEVVALVEAPGRDHQLPLDVRGTAFQEAVWQALRTVPAGETRSYAELAAAIGRPAATRAVGSACGANPLAVAVPCHRARRADGSPGGYAWGLERKRALLARERRE